MLSITWDEAQTYTEFVRNGHVILTDYNTMSANNHILNTFLMVVFTKAFGVSEFVMRIPSLAAHFIFLLFSARLLKHLDNKWLIISAFIVVNINPYMLDFFSLARGYGLSLGLMMASVYYFYLFHIMEKKGRYAILSVLMACFAVIANFVLLNYCLVLFGILVLLNIYFFSKSTKTNIQKRIELLKGVGVPLVIMILMILFVTPVILKLKEANALFFGGVQNFWKDTMSTITDRCFYEIGYNYWVQRVAKGFVFLVVISAIILIIQKLRKKQLSTNILFLLSVLLLLILCSISTIVQHQLFKTPYLMDRTALFFVVLFGILFSFFISEIAKHRESLTYVSHLSAFLMILHFFAAFNLTYVLEWKLDSETKEMLKDLNKIKEIPKEKETISLGIPLCFDPAINYYRAQNDLTWLNSTWKYEITNLLHDYFYLNPEEMSKIKMDSIEIIKEYPITHSVLAKRKYAPQIHPAIEKTMDFNKEKNQSFLIDEKVEYGPTFSYIVTKSVTPSTKGFICFYANVKTNDIKKDNLMMIISFQDSSGKLYFWQKAYVKDFIKNDHDWFRASFSCIVPSETKEGDELKAYIWNPDKHLLFIKQMDFKWLEYKF